MISHLQLFRTMLKMIGMHGYGITVLPKYISAVYERGLTKVVDYENVTHIRFTCGGQHSYYWGFNFDSLGKFIDHQLGEDV